MELLAAIPLVGPFLSAAIPFIIVLAIVVFVHEYGHYIVGRWCGIGAETFSIGFGRELFGWTDSRGTRWRVGALPLGGYVKFLGDVDASSSVRDPAALAKLTREERLHAFHTASVGRRALTVVAGPVANFLLTIAIFAVIGFAQGQPMREPVIGGFGEDANPEFVAAMRAGDRVLAVDGAPVADFGAMTSMLIDSGARPVTLTVARDGAEVSVETVYNPPARIDGVAPGGAARDAGLEAGDLIVSVDGAAITGFPALQARIAEGGGQPVTLGVLRDGDAFEVTLTPRMEGDRPLIGVQKQTTEIEQATRNIGLPSAILFGVERTWMIITLSLTSLWDAATGAQDAGEVLGGPIRIAEISGQAAGQGVGVFIGLIAVLSTSIGLINLFPVPVLDGGHLLFYGIEKLRGRPLKERWQEIGNSIGLGLVLALMAFATLNDIARL
ncbi:MAG: RIP metalloprotease RseP [Rhodobacteraceae bacterium]|nr:MAG: RIP metalloprotease RseP [Paracoccaceae bacterium]